MLEQSKDDGLFCREFKNSNRRLLEYKGFRTNTLKLILEYSFNGFLLKISNNHQKLQFDIYLHKHHPVTQTQIDLDELSKFSSFYGAGFNLILV